MHEFLVHSFCSRDEKAMNIHVVSCVTCIGMDSLPSTSLPTTLQASLDAEMKRLQGKGTGSSTKQAEVLTKEEEDLLWEKELLGDATPQSLWSSTLRSGKEHRQLRSDPCQIGLIEQPGETPCLKYVDVSKNRPGGIKGKRI